MTKHRALHHKSGDIREGKQFRTENLTENIRERKIKIKTLITKADSIARRVKERNEKGRRGSYTEEKTLKP